MSDNAFAVVFPGQGSQAVGMLSALAEQYPLVEQTFAEASEVLGYDLWALSQAGPQEKLNLTETTQPLLLTSSVAIWRVWRERDGALPQLMGGHSLGEFSALVCAEAMQFGDAVDLVRQRGSFMQAAVPVGEGAMAAIIGLDDDKILTICQSISGEQVVQAANFNSPGQVVIAGHTEAVNAAIDACKAEGAKRAMLLPVSAPFHTVLMTPAGERLAQVLDGMALKPPIVPVVHNVHAKTETDPEKIKALLVEQISSPVLWTQCAQSMQAQGITAMIECGPGKVLSGLAKRIDKSIQGYPTETPDALNKAIDSVS